jgi:hypothetical protein
MEMCVLYSFIAMCDLLRMTIENMAGVSQQIYVVLGFWLSMVKYMVSHLEKNLSGIRGVTEGSKICLLACVSRMYHLDQQSEVLHPKAPRGSLN